MWLTRVSVKNPVFAGMMMLALLVLGAYSWSRLGVEEFPDVQFPVVAITAEYPGAAPEAVEADVTRPVERTMASLPGIKAVYSTSREGLSLVVAEFELSTDIDRAIGEVRDKLAALRPALRNGVKEFRLARQSMEDRPIASLAMASASHDLRELSAVAERLVARRLRSVAGVGEVILVGATPAVVEVRIDPLRLKAAGLAIDQVGEALRNETGGYPAGALAGERREALLHVGAPVADPRRLADVPLARRGGLPVRLGDVAEVVPGQAERRSAALVDGHPALSLDIYMVRGANVIEVADRLRRTVEELQAELQDRMRLGFAADRSVGIRNSLADVRRTLAEGTLLAVAVVFVFLGSWRSTVITGLTLPIALLGTCFAMLLLGFSLNVMTLTAMSISIGLLVDDAIVVRENIVRHLAAGKSLERAALEGTREIGLAVLATTLTVVAVFLPVGFMGGTIGRFFYPFGLTVAAAVLLSMFVSFTLDPMLSSHWPDPHIRRKGWGDGLAVAYSRLIAWSLRHRRAVLAAALATLAASFGAAALVGTEFVPKADVSEIHVRARTPPGSSLEYTTAKARQLEAALRESSEVYSTYATVNSGGWPGRNHLGILVRLKPRHDRDLGHRQLVPRLRERLQRIAGVDITSVIGMDPVYGNAKPLQVSIQGPETEVLRGLALQLAARTRCIPGAVDVETSLDDPQPTLAVDIDRPLADDLGISTRRIGETLRALVEGDAVAAWLAPDGEVHDIVVRLPGYRRSLAGILDGIHLASDRTDAVTGAPLLVPLGRLARIRETTSANEINRRSMLREVRVMADASGRPAGDIGRDLRAAMGEIPLPPGYRFETGGSDKEMEESFGHAVSALALGVIFIYLILASQFGRLLQPLAIMTSLPLALIGAFLGLLAGGSTLNVFSAIGVIMLMGLVAKNAILLVDFVEKAVRRGIARDQAIIDAGRTRLRPILMTTCAMVFGMLPLALGLGEGAEQRAPMAHAVIGGVITSTLLTLVVVPVAYTCLDDLGRRLRAVLGSGPGDRCRY